MTELTVKLSKPYSKPAENIVKLNQEKLAAIFFSVIPRLDRGIQNLSNTSASAFSKTNLSICRRSSGELTYHVLDIMQAILEASDQGKHIELKSTCEQPAPMAQGLAQGEID